MTAEREALAHICACYPKNSNAHRIASQALANPATIRDTDEDAEWLQRLADRGDATGDQMLFEEPDRKRLNAIAARLASSPAEPDGPTAS